MGLRPIVLTAVAGAALLAPSALGASQVHTPKRGQYVGETRQDREFTLYKARKRVSRVEFEFDCGFASGRSAVRRIKLHRTKRGYAFSFKGRRSVTYADGSSPQKASLSIAGRFARGGTKARGTLRVKSKHCGGSGKVRWSARYTSPPVKTPKRGTYGGKTAQGLDVALYVSERSIDLADIQFSCGAATGRTSLNSIPMRRTRKGYAFEISANGSVTYSDDHPDENAAVTIAGRFRPAGGRASGRLSVDAPRCGASGPVSFAVKRRTDS